MPLTILCAGTCFDRSNSDELFGALAASVQSPMIFNPGPGSAEEYHLRRRSPRTGRAPPRPLLDEVVARGAGVVSGDGVLQAIDRTVSAIAAWRPRPTEINIAGWSRGAVCAIGLANAMRNNRALRSLPINMFLVDPVPGPGPVNSHLWTDQFTTLGPNVKHCCVLLMMHEAEYLFPPILRPFRQDGAIGHTYFEVYPLPGVHGSAVVRSDPFPSVRDIGWHLCHDFLHAHGTRIRNRFRLTAPQLCERYAAAKRVSDATERPLLRIIPTERRGLNERYFITLDHRDAFLEAWPAVHDVITHARNTQAAADNLRTIRSQYPNTWRVLVAAGAVNLGDFMRSVGIDPRG